MTATTRRTLCAAMLMAALATTATAANAFPEKPLTLVVPSVPGGAADALGRLVAEGLSRQLAQTVVVDNRPGAGATIGTQSIMRSPADGYTLLLALDTAFITAPFLLAKPPYQPRSDFAPVGMLATLQYVLVASPQSKIESVDGLVTKARLVPGTITYASGGEGSVHHLAMELLQRESSISMRHVPFKAAPQGFIDVMGGHVDTMFIASGTALPAMKSKKVIGLASSGQAPLQEAVPLPTIAQSASAKGYVYESWFGLAVRSGTPESVMQRLRTALGAALATPQAISQAATLGVALDPRGADAMARRIVEDTERYAGVIAKLKEDDARP